jgi:hypothetical protein
MRPSERAVTAEEFSEMFRWVRSLSGLLHTDHHRDDALSREWDRLRAHAQTPAERAEIDAIFSRHVA